MGANVKTVQQMLGHSSASVTLDVYSHAFPALSEQLREGFEATYQDSLAASSRPGRVLGVTDLDGKRAENVG